MKIKFDGYNWLIRLEKGELLTEQLAKIVADEKIDGAWISGLGAAGWAEIGIYNLENKTYQWQKLEGPLEIISLQGNVAWQDGKPVLHIHATFSDGEMKALGGHLKELEVAGTCEVLLHRWYKDQLTRSLDSETGLNLLDI